MESVQKLKQRRQKPGANLYTPSDMFSDQDVLELIKTCDHPHDKCLVALLYEALRPHEALKLKVGDVTFNDKYAQITIPNETKTGIRTIPIIFSFPYLRNWLNNHAVRPFAIVAAREVR